MNRLPPRSTHPRSRRSAGFTIIEVLVAMVGMMVIGGIILEVYVETERAAKKMVQRQAAVDFAVSFTDQASELLRTAVNPSNLDVEVRPAFGADRFSVPAYGDPASNGLFLVTVRPTENAADDGRPYEIVREVVAGAGGSTGASQTVNSFGPALAEAVPAVSFRYATEARPGDVAYVNRLEPDQWPVLVEITVEVPTPGEGEEPVRMRTAVIPGRLGVIAAVGPTPVPTPVSAAPGQAAEMLLPASGGEPLTTAPVQREVPAVPATETQP